MSGEEVSRRGKSCGRRSQICAMSVRARTTHLSNGGLVVGEVEVPVCTVGGLVRATAKGDVDVLEVDHKSGGCGKSPRVVALRSPTVDASTYVINWRLSRGGSAISEIALDVTAVCQSLCGLVGPDSRTRFQRRRTMASVPSITDSDILLPQCMPEGRRGPPGNARLRRPRGFPPRLSR